MWEYCQTPNLDANDFGMSIFWRSAVYDWKTSTGQKAPTVDLGDYEEPIRKFLLGNAPFPDDVVLAIDIWPYKDVLPLLHPVVTEQLPQGVRRYWGCTSSFSLAQIFPKMHENRLQLLAL
jgi:hypothetical protein